MDLWRPSAPWQRLAAGRTPSAGEAGLSRRVGPGRVARTAALLLASLPVLGGSILVAVACLPVLAGYRGYIVRSGSMAPAIPVGAVVVTRPVAPAELRVGDVISFATDRRPGVVVTHRIAAIEPIGAVAAGAAGAPGYRVVTKGDANEAEDAGTVDLDRPVGRLAYAVPWAGYLVHALGTWSGRLAALGAGGVLLWLWGTGSGVAGSAPASRPARRLGGLEGPAGESGPASAGAAGRRVWGGVA